MPGHAMRTLAGQVLPTTKLKNINTKTLKKGDKVCTHQVWLDTTKFTEAHNIQSVGVTDKYDSANLTVNGADIKAYDSVTGEDVTAKFDIKVEKV
ncbi:MAG: SspB-related isopeptide-forming adhesin [Streptococcus sp.]